MKTYEVSGPFAFRGVEPGKTFTANPADPGIKRALNRGSISAITPPSPATPSADAGPNPKEKK